MAGPTLHVTDKTSVANLQTFASQLGAGDKVRGKEHKDGSITLYVSKKEGTGLKNWLFGTTAKRRSAAQGAITQILFANTKRIDSGPMHPRSQLDDSMTYALGSLPQIGSEVMGKSVKEIASAAVDAWAEAFKPSGMNVGAHGAITGHLNLTTAVDRTDNSVKPLLSLFQSSAQGLLGNTKNVGGVVITEKANDDLTRMNCRIGNYNTMGPEGGDGTPEMNAKKVSNAQRLVQFAGTGNAAKVLSSVTNQYMLRPLETALQTPSGDKMRMLLATNGNPNDYTYKDSNGVSHNVGKPPQYAAAQYRLEKYNDGTGDFKVSVSWDLYATGFQNPDLTGRIGLPTPNPDRVVKTTTTVEWRINKQDADRGVLTLTMPTPPRTTFDGHLY